MPIQSIKSTFLFEKREERGGGGDGDVKVLTISILDVDAINSAIVATTKFAASGFACNIINVQISTT